MCGAVVTTVNIAQNKANLSCNILLIGVFELRLALYDLLPHMKTCSNCFAKKGYQFVTFQLSRNNKNTLGIKDAMLMFFFLHFPACFVPPEFLLLSVASHHLVIYWIMLLSPCYE